MIQLNARFLRTFYEPGSQKEHRQLLHLCQQGAVEEACSLPREHIAATGAKLTESLQKLR